MSDLSKDEIIEKLISQLSFVNGVSVTMFLSDQYPNSRIRPKPHGWSALNIYRETTRVLNDVGFSNKISNKQFMEVFEDLFNKARPICEPPTLDEVHEKLKEISNND